jgi:Flp pilus assembly protein TadB
VIGFLAALGWERHARRQERRKLDEQAERQRLRAPEPFDVEEHVAEQQGRLTDGEVKMLLAIPVTVLAVLALINPWIFWIGLLVLCGVVIPILVVKGEL